MESLAGIFCALWTPTDYRGEILWQALDEHLAFVFESGVGGLMALGSTGEFVHFDLPQRKSLLRHLAAGCQKHSRRLVANVSDIQIRNVLELAICAKDEGADCIAVLPPWFFPTEQRDLAQFFIRAAETAEVPLILYNFPEVTGKKIELSTIRAVAEKVRVVAVKQSGAQYDFHHELLELGRELGFVVLTGSDTRLAETLQLGCTGTISGLANCVPEALCKIYVNTRAGLDSSGETKLVAEVAQAMSGLQFPLNVKATLQARGFETGTEKMPISTETEGTYKLTVERLEELYRRARLPIRGASN